MDTTRSSPWDAVPTPERPAGGGGRTSGRPHGSRAQRTLRAIGQGWADFFYAMTHAFVFSLQLTAIVCTFCGFGTLFLPATTAMTRRAANAARRRARERCGIEIEEPYLPEPRFQDGFMGRLEQCRWILADRSTWRDLAWMILDPFVGGFLGALAGSLVVESLYGVVLFAFWPLLTKHGMNDWYGFVHVSRPPGVMEWRWAALPMAGMFFGLGVVAPEPMLRAHARWSSTLLSPSQKARLALRVARLTETRTDAVDAQAAELRRIERDLHDGAQARLVAMGMNLGAAEALLDQNPEAVRALLVEARESSAKALTELRELVRGIHPPVLADRGLGDAVRAVALDSALTVEVQVELPGRLEPAVESAAYFAICELLTNTAKHAHARTSWIDIRHTQGRLCVTCTDDGLGGAKTSAGSGLAGIERRIGAFDGIMAVTSPQGGPTVVSLEIPCVLSSEKTSTS
jgi:signal transduction histidine kinase